MSQIKFKLVSFVTPETPDGDGFECDCQYDLVEGDAYPSFDLLVVTDNEVTAPPEYVSFQTQSPRPSRPPARTSYNQRRQ